MSDEENYDSEYIDSGDSDKNLNPNDEEHCSEVFVNDGQVKRIESKFSVKIQ